MGLDSIVGVLDSIPLDWMIVGGIALCAALYCLRSGAQMICTLALALLLIGMRVGGRLHSPM